MDLNDELSPSEQTSLRERITSGAGRMRSVRAKRAGLVAGAAAAVVVAVVVAGVAFAALRTDDGSVAPVDTHSASPAPSRTPTPSVSPSPTPTPTQPPPPTQTRPPGSVSPEVLLDGDCEALLPQASAPTELGAIPPNGGGSADVGLRTLGGISCSYFGDSLVLVAAFPRGVVADDIVERYREPVCEGFQYDGYGCRVGRESGGSWALTTLGPSQWGDEVTATPLLDQTADAVAEILAEVSPGIPVAPTVDWWEVDCAAVGHGLDLEEILGAGGVEEGYPADGGSDVDAEVAERAGASLGDCSWYAFAGEELRALQVWPYPGGGWAWGDAALADVQSITVAGATDAHIGTDANGRTIAELTDGTNLVRVDLSEIAHDVSSTLNAILVALSG